MPEIARMKPLIFCPRSLLAWQQGAKTQTRRLVRPQPLEGLSVVQTAQGLWDAQDETRFELLCQPYAVGDLLWIQEGLVRSCHPMDDDSFVLYQADWKPVFRNAMGADWTWNRDNLAAMFMPRWACRYYARVVSLRAERLQDITDEDAVAEGVLVGVSHDHDLPRWLYVEWWASLHRNPGTRWPDNPWVWVYGLEAADASSEPNIGKENDEDVIQ